MEESYKILTDPLPSNDVSLHFNIEPPPSATTHFSLLES